jgi:thiol-disulfide isomerase/thioredoxin
MRSLAVLSAVAMMALAGSARSAAAQDMGIEVGAKAPGAVVQSLDGGNVDLAQFIGKTPVLIEFWATWCPNCKELEPSLLAAHEKYNGRVRFIGVAVSVNESPERVKLYAAKHHFKHDVYFDTHGAASAAYDVPATSYVVVIDKAGKFVYTGLGGDQKLEEAIAKAM